MTVCYGLGVFGLDSGAFSGTLGALNPKSNTEPIIMGQQLKKVAKRRRRQSYLTRKKALAKAGVSRKARAAARSESKAKKPAAKKTAAKKSAKPKAVEAAETTVAPVEAVETAPAAETAAAE